jgi:hypothetical protein
VINSTADKGGTGIKAISRLLFSCREPGDLRRVGTGRCAAPRRREARRADSAEALHLGAGAEPIGATSFGTEEPFFDTFVEYQSVPGKPER